MGNKAAFSARREKAVHRPPCALGWSVVREGPAIQHHCFIGDLEYSVDLLFDDQQRRSCLMNLAQAVVDHFDHERGEA
jgi:hypothetical protein